MEAGGATSSSGQVKPRVGQPTLGDGALASADGASAAVDDLPDARRGCWDEFEGCLQAP